MLTKWKISYTHLYFFRTDTDKVNMDRKLAPWNDKLDLEVQWWMQKGWHILKGDWNHNILPFWRKSTE